MSTIKVILIVNGKPVELTINEDSIELFCSVVKQFAMPAYERKDEMTTTGRVVTLVVNG
jgi:hypothetical protein